MEQANNVETYLRLIEKCRAQCDEIYYRGQSEKYTNMQPSIARNEGYLKNEGQIYEESIDMMPDEFQALASPLERLSKMQHYGIPTRLVDVTIEPLIALFFAVVDIKSEHPGNVYVYLSKGCDFEDKRVKALSLLATVHNYDLEHLCNEFRDRFEVTINSRELLSLIEKPLFIKHCDELKASNSRLYNQKGAFVICSNVIENGNIKKDLNSLDTINSSMVIRIPYEYKKQIKDELDNLGINDLTVYPELPSVGDYIRTKYNKDNFSLDETYVLMNKKDISIAGARRILFFATLKSPLTTLKPPLTIEQIIETAFGLIDQYRPQYDVITVHIAKNGEDYIMSNWILSAQWINPMLDQKYRPPVPFEINYSDGYYLKKSTSYSTLNDLYKNNAFDDDKTLFRSHQKIYNCIIRIYQEFRIANENYIATNFLELIKKNQEALHNLSIQCRNFAHSIDPGFDDFLYRHHLAVYSLDNLHYLIENDKLNEKKLHHEINRCLTRAKKEIDLIEQHSNQWKKKLKITDLES